MEIKIEVPEEKFKDVLQEELKAFSKEELHNICREGLISCMSNPDDLKTFFKNDEKSYYYDDGSIDVKRLLRTAVEKIDFSPLFDDLKIEIINYVKENYNDLIKSMLFDIFITGLSNNVYNNSLFRENLQHELINLNCEIQQDLNNNYVRKQ